MTSHYLIRNFITTNFPGSLGIKESAHPTTRFSCARALLTAFFALCTSQSVLSDPHFASRILNLAIGGLCHIWISHLNTEPYFSLLSNLGYSH